MIYADAYELAKPHLEYFLLGPLLQRVITRIVAAHPGVRLTPEGRVLSSDARVLWGTGIGAALLVNEVVAEVVLASQKRGGDGPCGELLFTAEVTSRGGGSELEVRVGLGEDFPQKLATSGERSPREGESEHPVIEALAAQCEATVWWDGCGAVRMVVGVG